MFNLIQSFDKLMKIRLMLGLALMASLVTTQASLLYQGGGINTVGGTAVGTVANGGTIYDGSLAGSVFTMNLSSAGLGSQLTDIQVSLNVSGGINGNLYAYLVAPDGTSVMLLNRPGVVSGNPFGNTQSGLNLTLANGGSTIVAGSDLSSGTYAVPTANGNSLVNFGSESSPGVNPNGTWTLFFADMVAGGGNETLNGWSLEITAVPEPVNVALVGLGVVFVSVGVLRKLRNSKYSPSLSS